MSVSVAAPVKRFVLRCSGLIPIRKAEVILPKGGPENLIEEAIDNCPVSCIYEDD
jgi:ferredoxin